MEIKQWTMQEDFIFPGNVGIPAGAEVVSVTPMFSEERTADGVRLTGIYHIAANVLFEEGESVGEGERAEETLNSAILIDDVELEGNGGYFEYAVPLHIDLPPEAGNPIQVVTTSATNESDGQGSFSVVWDVECSYVESVAKAEAPAAVASVVDSSSFAIGEKPSATAAVVEEPPTAAIVEEAEQTVEAEAPTMTAQAEEVEEQVALEEDNAATATAVAINDSAYVEYEDEALSFIAGLEDGVSTTLFRSNDVFVKQES
ncbi:hypothetical protein MHZ95_17215 [Sporosarcina sp. ACRSM]|uniref:hypothetical protein n=1 Tax=Sporosarcina sp. ACRSM TaxID=2918216 RepID=UPI001EF5A106|nr:hypothetical protein [Sporosarcina sp. ACRSM]MCG7337002.1 hypothetical protein [Sporosarcina sp. ACRSM]